MKTKATNLLKKLAWHGCANNIENSNKVLVSIFILTKFEILANILQLGTILNQER